MKRFNAEVGASHAPPAVLIVAPILVVAPNWVGDAVMTQPFIDALFQAIHQQTQQQAKEITPLHVLAPVQVAAVYRAMPQVTHVIDNPFTHGKLEWRARAVFASRLQNYSAAYVLPNSFKSALIPWLARIPKRVAYRGEMRGALLTQALPNPAKHQRPDMVAFYRALAEKGGKDSSTSYTQTQDESLPAPQLHVDVATQTQALKKFNVPNKRLLVLCPGAEYGPAKQWSLEYFSALAQQMQSESDCATLILGGSKDAAFGEKIVQGVALLHQDRVLNLCGKTSLDEVFALIAASACVVSNDSGLMHVAAALGTPVAALFGSTDPRHTPPHAHAPQLAHIAWQQLECAPCFKRVCPLQGAAHMRCMRELSPEKISPFVLQHLHNNPTIFSQTHHAPSP